MQCRELLSKNYPLLPLQTLKKKWNTACSNKETLSGYPVHLFPNLTNIGKHCFRPDEMHFLTKNPYTGKMHKLTKKERLTTETAPITQIYNKDICPVESKLKSTPDEEYFFISSSTPYKSVKDLPSIISHDPIVSLSISASRVINPANIFSKHYYIAKLKKKMPDKLKHLMRRDIKYIYPLYTKELADTIIDKIQDQKLIKDLNKYFCYESQTIPDTSLKLLEELSIKLPEPIKAYRGMLIHNLEELKTLGLDHLEIGSKLLTVSRSLPVSWSTDSCISQYFATNSPAKVFKDKGSLQFGILYSTELQPRQIAIDTRIIDRKYFKNTLYMYDQQEVITFPLQKDGKMEEFPCVVERLFIVDVRSHKVVIVKSFEKMVKHLQKYA